MTPDAQAAKFVSHAQIFCGVVFCGFGMTIRVRGRSTARGCTTTREGHPVAFLLTVVVLRFVELPAIYPELAA